MMMALTKKTLENVVVIIIIIFVMKRWLSVFIMHY